MKVICEGLDLSSAVLTVSKAIGSKTVNPILEGIKLVAEEDKDGDGSRSGHTDALCTLGIMDGHIMANLTQRLADQRGGRCGKGLAIHEGHRLDAHADGVCGVGIGAQTGDGLGEDDDTEAHGQLLDHGRQTDAGDVGDDVLIQTEGALGELKTGVLVLFADGIDGHDQSDCLTHNGGQRSTDNFQTGEAELTVDEDPVEGDVDDVGHHIIDHGCF